MFLTIYYITATFLQSWRIRSICSKITEKLTEKATVVFYNIPTNGNGVDGVSATSELCLNRSQARISDFLWLRENQRGCSLVPVQCLHLGPWISFPEPPNLVPFELNKTEENFEFENDSKQQRIQLLLETDIIPTNECEEDAVIMIENYGKPLAWKVDSHVAFVLETDIDHFTKLVMATFMQDKFSINDRLPLIRIESVCCEGTPQPFELVKNHLRKQLTNRAMRHLSLTDWEKHLTGLRSLSVFANQATEFEYNKNRTEGKTGIVKPDLIPSKNVQENTSSSISTSNVVKESQKSPIKKVTLKTSSSSSSPTPMKIEAKVSPIRQQQHPQQKLQEPQKPKIDNNISKSPPTAHLQTKTAEKFVNEKCSNSKINQFPSVEKSEPDVKVDKQKSSEIKIEKIEQVPPPANKTQTPEENKVLISNTKENNLVKQEVVNTVPTTPLSKSDDAKRPSLIRSKGSLSACKPPNILVYSDSSSVRTSVISTLKQIIEKDMYTVYPLVKDQISQNIWMDNTTLLVICGTVESSVGQALLEYFLKGGRMLSICSDILHIILPTYRTAEVREHELVQFSYDKWHKVKMMHHIFCYQPSPVKKHFSTEGEDSSTACLTKKPALVCPRSIELKDLQGDSHSLEVKILGNEETWNTPSILLANNIKSGGRAVFSQVHLEADPCQFESDETKYAILKQNDSARIEILCDILSKHLEIAVMKADKRLMNGKIIYQNAFFLGRHESKFELLEKLKSKMNNNGIIRNNYIGLKFYGKNEIASASYNSEYLPILIHSCPEDFSTVNYFDNLGSKFIGRLVIYTPVVTSSMHILSGLNLTHGIAIIPRRQTCGSGRNNNEWISPEGCAMFSLQLHIPLDSALGKRIALIQHLISTAIVHGILETKGYEGLDIRLKWPNDIYVNGITKLGGLVVNSEIQNSMAICNIGCALNLNNSMPTTCLNEVIREYNTNHNKKLPPFEYEKTLAIMFTEIEKLLDVVQSGDFNFLYNLYYKYWLHGNQKITILDKKGNRRDAKIIGIDDYGYLQVQSSNGNLESVQPDGNSFDMLQGLILPK